MALYYKLDQLSALILHHRKKIKLSRASLALFAGVGKTAIYDIEHGKKTVQLDTLLKILKALNIAIEFRTNLEFINAAS
jgi:transcriptional regulator with XRE-family HTH domain